MTCDECFTACRTLPDQSIATIAAMIAHLGECQACQRLADETSARLRRHVRYREFETVRDAAAASLADRICDDPEAFDVATRNRP